jgi:hypothetical protein
MDDLPIINFNDTPPLPSVVVPLRPIQLNYTQYILLDYISKLYKYLSSFEEFKKGVARFYIKGGAATPLLLKKHNLYGLFQKFPFQIENDIDAELLIDPEMKGDARNYIQKKLILSIINHICMYFSSFSPSVLNGLIGEWKDAGFTYTGPYTGKIQVVDKGFTANNFVGSDPFQTLFLDSALLDLSLKNSPFSLFIHPNYFFESTPLNITLIQLRPNLSGEDGNPVFEISMPKASNDSLVWNWISGAETITNVLPGINLPIADTYSVYFDAEVSSALNSRKNKKALRKYRADLMRNYIFYPYTSQKTRSNLLKYRENALKPLETHKFKNGRTVKNLLKAAAWPFEKINTPLKKPYHAKVSVTRRSGRKNYVARDKN